MILLAGCATQESVLKNYSLINYADGLNEREAKTIAQQHLINHELKDKFPWKKPNSIERKHYWQLEFSNSGFFDLVGEKFVLHISKTNGEVIRSGVRPEGLATLGTVFLMGMQQDLVRDLMYISAAYYQQGGYWQPDQETLEHWDHPIVKYIQPALVMKLGNLHREENQEGKLVFRAPLTNSKYAFPDEWILTISPPNQENIYEAEWNLDAIGEQPREAMFRMSVSGDELVNITGKVKQQLAARVCYRSYAISMSHLKAFYRAPAYLSNRAIFVEWMMMKRQLSLQISM